MRKLFLTTFLALTMLFIAIPNLHAVTRSGPQKLDSMLRWSPRHWRDHEEDKIFS
ncbi:hypothetical protein SAMN05660653_01702 [Desulfonatronum thiosulfatophilum]|uniref:Uncharacterized protein n=1 Tax=Desulfonatronum thiosulfatophilum TaxID=617002 RepID=A0A1G6CTQ1_9BACT|nr:hypothetical protein [Desulfonatronum thiosulfatophilum]SDB36135.1 hypothetical protein SAMN05660653_01702 [Desulfonatronum thiosulfatophilum]